MAGSSVRLCRERTLDDAGRLTNAELLAGISELWLDGAPNWWAQRDRRPEEWIGIWVTNVDSMFERVVQQGVQAKPPENKFFGVRVLQVTDPEGYTWGFMQRAPFVARAPT